MKSATHVEKPTLAWQQLWIALGGRLLQSNKVFFSSFVQTANKSLLGWTWFRETGWWIKAWTVFADFVSKFVELIVRTYLDRCAARGPCPVVYFQKNDSCLFTIWIHSMVNLKPIVRIKDCEK